MTGFKKYSYIYWFIPVFLFSVQVVYTLNSFNQIRTEELVTSIRSVWWFQHRLVFNGAFSDLGWYGPLNIIYNLFGFDLYTAKYVRLVIAAVSLFCLAAVLKRLVGIRYAWLPLLIMGLSPSLLYFNVLQVQYGLDLQLFPICLYLVLILDFKSAKALPVQAGLALLSMLAWMAYPVFMYYLPVLGIIYFYKLRKQLKKRKEWSRHIAVSVSAFLVLPLAAIIYIKNRELLWFDPLVGRGMFRGNGTVDLDPAVLWENARFMIWDLFIMPLSYYFEATKVEFSDIYPIISLVIILLGSVYLARYNKKLKWLVTGLLAALFLGFIFSLITGPVSGLRRGSHLLVLFYTLFTVVWFEFLKNKNPLIRRAVLAAGLILLIHHLIILPANIEHLKRHGQFSERVWYSVKETPGEALDFMVEQVQQKDLGLICKDEKGDESECDKLTLIYPTIDGSCIWNKLQCHQVVAYSNKEKKLVPLSIDYWPRSNKGF